MTIREDILSLCRSMLGAYNKGDLKQAIHEGEMARALAETVPDFQELELAEIYHNLGELYRLAGSFGKAMSAAKSAISIREKRLSPEDPLLANSLQTLAKIHDETDDPEAARNTYAEIISIRQFNKNSDPIGLAESLADYAAFLLNNDKTEECLTSVREAQSVYEQEGKTDACYYFALLFTGASALKRMGQWKEAEASYCQAVATLRKASGDNDPNVISALINLSEVYREQGKLSEADDVHQYLDKLEHLAGKEQLRLRLTDRGLLRGDQGRYHEALDDLVKAAKLDDDLLQDVFSFASQQQMLSKVRAIMGHSYAFLSLLLKEFAGDPHASSLALNLILRRKAIVQDSLSATGLEKSKRSPSVAPLLEGVDSNSVARAVPQGAALVEYLKYAPYNFASYPAMGKSRWGKPRYLALVIRPDTGPIPIVDLGEASEIDGLATGFRGALVEARNFIAAPKVKTREEAALENVTLRRRIFDPLETTLKGARKVFLSPDSEVSVLPFEVLPTDDGRYLVDDFEFAYLSSGRDMLLSRRVLSSSPTCPVVMAHPNYDLAKAAGASSPPLPSASASEPRIGPFEPLTETLAEGVQVARMLDVHPCLDDEAVKGALLNVHGPRVLHIATHGFFLPSRIADSEAAEGPSPERDAMRRSGLALAGANTYGSGGELPAEAGDGILYAQDVTQLDLVGTQLAVLSACDTARGEVRAGEGIFGLRRAFVLAGAKVLVMSLWRVHDTGTKELMIKFYQLLSEQKMSCSAALRHAQRWLREKYPDPAVWGAFICQGDETGFANDESP